MRKLTFLLLLSIAVLASAVADDLTILNSGREGCAPIPSDPQGCWSEPGDLGASAYSSMLYDMGMGDTLYSEVANDFIFEDDTDIVLVRWWAGVW